MEVEVDGTNIHECDPNKLQLKDVKFPHGCEPIDLKLELEVIYSRLKGLSSYLKRLCVEDEDDSSVNFLLLYYLISDRFVKHRCSKLRCKTATCVVWLLHLFRKDIATCNQKNLMTALLFLLLNLNGLCDSGHELFKYYFSYLEALGSTHVLCDCIYITDQAAKLKISCHLFEGVFQLINAGNKFMISSKLSSILQTYIHRLVNHIDVSPLLDIVFSWVVKPVDENTQPIREFISTLIMNCIPVLETHIHQYFLKGIEVETLGLVNSSSDTNKRISDCSTVQLISELYKVCPVVSQTSLCLLKNQLLDKKYPHRLEALDLYMELFSKGNSGLVKCEKLWFHFLHSLNTGTKHEIRSALQNGVDLLLNSTREMRVEFWKKFILHCLCDLGDNKILEETIDLLLSVTLRDTFFLLSSECNVLKTLHSVIENHEEFSCRKKALKALSQIYEHYKKYDDEKVERKISWVINIVFSYVSSNISTDRAVAERVFVSIVLPHDVSMEERMEHLLDVWFSLNDSLRAVFHMMQRNCYRICENMTKLLSLLTDKNVTVKEEDVHICEIAELLDVPDVDRNQLRKFVGKLKANKQLYKLMCAVLNKEKYNPEERSNYSVEILKLLEIEDRGICYTLYGLMFKLFHFNLDHSSYQYIASFLMTSLVESDTENLDVLNRGKIGLELLNELMIEDPRLGFSKDVLECLVSFLDINEGLFSLPVLKIFVTVGLYKPLGKEFPEFLDEKLLHVWLEYAIKGPLEMSKYAIHCLSKHCHERLQVFQILYEEISKSLQQMDDNYVISISALGYIAKYTFSIFDGNSEFVGNISLLISEHIPKLFEQNSFSQENITLQDWPNESKLPVRTKCLIAALKSIALWICALNDSSRAKWAFKLFCGVISDRGSCNSNGILSETEKACLRLSASRNILKICKNKKLWLAFTSENFLCISQIMNDDNEHVRREFARAVAKGLSKERGLPTSFFALYALATYEKNGDIYSEIMEFLDIAFTSRRDLFRRLILIEKVARSYDSIANTSPEYLIEYCLNATVFILSHHLQFKSTHSIKNLILVMNGLQLIMNKLVSVSQRMSAVYYEEFFTRLQKCVGSLKPNCTITNQKIWVTCEIGMLLVSHLCKSKTGDITPKTCGLSRKFFYPPENVQREKILDSILLELLTKKLKFNIDVENEEDDTSSLHSKESTVEENIPTKDEDKRNTEKRSNNKQKKTNNKVAESKENDCQVEQAVTEIGGSHIEVVDLTDEEEIISLGKSKHVSNTKKKRLKPSSHGNQDDDVVWKSPHYSAGKRRYRGASKRRQE